MIKNVNFDLRLKESCRNLDVNNGRMRNNMQESVQTSFQIAFYELINEGSGTEYSASIDDKCDQRVCNVNQFHEHAGVFVPRIHTEPRQHMPIHHQWLHFHHFHLLRLFLPMKIYFTKYLWITNDDSIIKFFEFLKKIFILFFCFNSRKEKCISGNRIFEFFGKLSFFTF